MPKLRLTEQQQRERALQTAIARAAAAQGFKLEKEIAGLLGMSPPNYSYYKKSGFQSMSLETFARLVRGLGITGQELCACFGVPYREVSA